MVQEIIVYSLFVLAIGYFGYRFYKSQFTKKKDAALGKSCGGSCDC